MITERNYSKKAMKHYTDILPKGWKRKLSDNTGYDYDLVCDVADGKQYDHFVINEIMTLFENRRKEFALAR